MGFDNSKVRKLIEQKLFDTYKNTFSSTQNTANIENQSAVLLPVGTACNNSDHPEEACIILTKRSDKVKQSGDLCCPGGRVSRIFDTAVGRGLTLPFSPLTCWTFWSSCRLKHPYGAKKLSVLYAASLRESFEEMRLNPFGVRFLGLLPPQQLRTREQYIFPMAGWIKHQKSFTPNQEVDKVVSIPIRDLLNTKNYSVFRLHRNEKQKQVFGDLALYYPCYRHRMDDETDILWGATFRIVMNFLFSVFEFVPPGTETLPVFDWQLHENYFVS